MRTIIPRRRGLVCSSPRNAFYSKLVKMILDKGFTVGKLAKTIGLRQPTVSQVITGARGSPRVRKLIAEALHARPDRIFRVVASNGETTRTSNPVQITKEQLREMIEEIVDRKLVELHGNPIGGGCQSGSPRATVFCARSDR
jgi:predicted transcriptional regulator